MGIYTYSFQVLQNSHYTYQILIYGTYNCEKDKTNTQQDSSLVNSPPFTEYTCLVKQLNVSHPPLVLAVPLLVKYANGSAVLLTITALKPAVVGVERTDNNIIINISEF